MPMADDEAMGGFGVGGEVVGGGRETEEGAFVFPLMGFTRAREGCWARIGSGLCSVSGKSLGRRCCGHSGMSVARVWVAKVVAVLRRADTSVTSGSSGIGSRRSKDTGKWLWYSNSTCFSST